MSEPTPFTRATQAATELGLTFEPRTIEPPRSLEEAAARLEVSPGRIVKTLVVRRADDDYLLVLVPGPRQIDWPKLRAHLGVSRLSMPDKDEARDATGYERGTITPLGASRPWPVIADVSVAGAGTVTIGGGQHGISLRVDADELLEALDADVADVTSA